MENADPINVYKKMMVEQVKVGLADPDSISEETRSPTNGSFKGVV